MLAARDQVDWASVDAEVRRWLRARAPASAIDDLAQEALLRAHRTMPSEIRHADAWAVTAARSVLVDAYRREARRPEAPTDPVALSALATALLSSSPS